MTTEAEPQQPLPLSSGDSFSPTGVEQPALAPAPAAMAVEQPPHSDTVAISSTDTPATSSRDTVDTSSTSSTVKPLENSNDTADAPIVVDSETQVSPVIESAGIETAVADPTKQAAPEVESESVESADADIAAAATTAAMIAGTESASSEKVVADSAVAENTVADSAIAEGAADEGAVTETAGAASAGAGTDSVVTDSVGAESVDAESKDRADPEKAPAADDNDTDTEDEADAPVATRVTRNRASLIRVQSSDTESESATTAPRTRTRRQRASVGDSSSKATSPKLTRGRRGRVAAAGVSDSGDSKSHKGKSKGGRKGRKGRKSKSASKVDKDDATESDDSSPGDYVHVEVGDCVLLDSGDPDDSFVALVSSVQRSQNFVKGPGTFTAQWYYKPDDVRDEVRALIPGGVLAHEVFLSPHKDKNSIDAVIGLCHVVSPDEYDEVQSEINRGYREKKSKPYYICRYKYYPNRSIKKALEVVRNDAIRSGLGPMKPKIGASFQADVPPFEPPVHKDDADAALRSYAAVPWNRAAAAAVASTLEFAGKQIWSPLVHEHHGAVLHQFLQLLKPVRFSVGNVLKVFRREDALVAAASGHVRCIVLASAPSDHVRVCLATGLVTSVLPSDLSSPLGDDTALAHLYRARFSVCAALGECTAALAKAQQLERDAFRMEVVEFAQLEARASGLLIESDEVDDDDDDDESESDASSASPRVDDDDHDDDDDYDGSGVRVRALRKRRK